MTNTPSTPSGNPDSNAVDPNFAPQAASGAPQAAPEAQQVAPEVTVDMCSWWLTTECGLNDADANDLMNVVTDNGNKPLIAKRFYRAYMNKSNEVLSAGGRAFPQIDLDFIGAKYREAHPAPVGVNPASDEYKDLTGAVDAENPPVAEPADPNAAPVDPNATTPTIPGEPATPDLTQGMPVTADPNAPVVNPNTPVVDPNAPVADPGTAPSTPNAPSPTDQPDFAPMPPTGGALVDLSGRTSGKSKLDPFIIAGVIGLAAAATIYGVSKSKGCNEGSSETGAVATASASASLSPTAKPTATASATPTATASAKPKDPSWVVKNKPEEVWVKCDNSSVPTNCTLPEDCRMNGVSLSRPASFECAGADGKWITYATPFKAEHTYPHGKGVELKFKLQD